MGWQPQETLADFISYPWYDSDRQVNWLNGYCVLAKNTAE